MALDSKVPWLMAKDRKVPWLTDPRGRAKDRWVPWFTAPRDRETMAKDRKVPWLTCPRDPWLTVRALPRPQGTGREGGGRTRRGSPVGGLMAGRGRSSGVR